MYNDTIDFAENQQIFEVIEGLNKQIDQQGNHATKKQKQQNRKKNIADTLKTDAVTKIVSIAKSHCNFYKYGDDLVYAIIQYPHGGKQCLNISSKKFKHFLLNLYYDCTNNIPTERNIDTAIENLTAFTQIKGEEKIAFTRFATYPIFDLECETDEKILKEMEKEEPQKYYIDLCNDEFGIIEISKEGWREIFDAPVNFVRTPGMLALPKPDRDGNVDELWELLNIEEKYRGIILAWIFESWRRDTPFPVLELNGEKGSGKSNTQYYLRQFIDPHKGDLLPTPYDIKNDIYMLTNSMYVLSYNNISYFHKGVQDAFCCVSTGGHDVKRKLYTDDDIKIYNLLRPIIVNGISSCITQEDLISRTISIVLKELKVSNREAKIKQFFLKNRSSIFGGLLNMFCNVLRALESVEIPNEVLSKDGLNRNIVPRLLDFAYLGEAVYKVLAKEKYQFLYDLDEIKAKHILRTVDGEPVFVAIQRYFEKTNDTILTGTISHLHATLQDYTRCSIYPSTPKKFGDTLTRIAEHAKIAGFEINKQQNKGTGGYRYATIRRLL